MLKCLFTLSLFATAFIFPMHSVHAEKADISEKSCCCPCATDPISTPFTLTPLDNTDYILTAIPISSGGFAIDSDGTITLPREGVYLIDFTLLFSKDQTTQTSQLDSLYNAIGAVQFIDSATGLQVGTLINYNGTIVFQAKGPILVTLFVYNPFTTIVPLNGFISVTQLY